MHICLYTSYIGAMYYVVGIAYYVLWVLCPTYSILAEVVLRARCKRQPISQAADGGQFLQLRQVALAAPSVSTRYADGAVVVPFWKVMLIHHM